jgi:hypothetical protein
MKVRRVQLRTYELDSPEKELHEIDEMGAYIVHDPATA